MPFTDATLYAVLGQILWLRGYLRALWVAVPSATVCPLAPLVLAGKVCECEGPKRVAITSSAAMCRVFNWFLRGGCRDTLPEDGEEELQVT